MLKKINIYVLNFFLVSCILILSSLVIISNTLLNKQYIINILEKNNYYERTYYTIQEGFKNYIMQSGLEEDVLEDLYDKDKVKNDINSVINAIYENTDINIDTEELVKKLDDRISNILEQKGRIPEEEEIEEIKIFENTISQVYVDGIAYSEEYIAQISDVYNKIQYVITKIEIVLSVVVLALISIIIVISKNMKEIINLIGIELVSVGTLNIILKILIGNRAHNIVLLNSEFSQSLIDLINSIVNKFYIVGTIMVIIGISVIILSKINKKYDK